LHDESPFLTIDDVQTIKETVFRYINEEKDYRGYVDGKGLAHSVAHIADVLVNIASFEIDNKYCLGREDIYEILEAVKFLVRNKECVYSTREETLSDAFHGCY